MKNAFHLGRGTVSTLDELFLEQMRDLYDAENQLVDALPKMEASAHDPALKQGFATHLEETKRHVQRLETIFDSLDEDPEGKTCQAMKGLIKEGKEVIAEHATPEVKDAALIAAAQRVEHYEMAGYGAVRSFAEILGNEDAAKLLQETLDEEGDTNKKLIAAAGEINFKIPVGKSR
jgi:ferritin-like metal-binding protein YciE